MHVSTYDTNTGDWRHKKFDTTLPIGPLVALDWLAKLNTNDRDNAPPVGPLSYSGDDKRFVLVSAWSGGRQWFEILAIFSGEKLADDDLDVLLMDNIAEEEEDEEDE